ncbi:hypothetical protein WJX73_008604 [Symbiochloris irregularis]|uniref:Ribosomal protein L2 n=1 Tax=Symbiochloris irregularis TaxID=706552 RepID=A0AAW1P497_9CHLO
MRGAARQRTLLNALQSTVSDLGVSTARSILSYEGLAQGQKAGALAQIQLWGGSVRQVSKLVKAGLKFYKPTTPSMRHRVTTDRSMLWKGAPYKALCEGMAKAAGRNNGGSITVWHRGGGHRQVYRKVDFARPPGDALNEVVRLEWDPNRSAHIALLRQIQTEGSPADSLNTDPHSYILAPQNVSPGDRLMAGPSADIKVGNALPLSSIPLGQTIHNVEMYPGKGGQIARAAGTSATLVSKGSDGYAVVKQPSGEQRRVLAKCTATIGTLSNPQHKNIKLGKAGANRWRGKRPTTNLQRTNEVVRLSSCQQLFRRSQ